MRYFIHFRHIITAVITLIHARAQTVAFLVHIAMTALFFVLYFVSIQTEAYAPENKKNTV